MNTQLVELEDGWRQIEEGAIKRCGLTPRAFEKRPGNSGRDEQQAGAGKDWLPVVSSSLALTLCGVRSMLPRAPSRAGLRPVRGDVKG